MLKSGSWLLHPAEFDRAVWFRAPVKIVSVDDNAVVEDAAYLSDHSAHSVTLEDGSKYLKINHIIITK